MPRAASGVRPMDNLTATAHAVPERKANARGGFSPHVNPNSNSQAAILKPVYAHNLP